MPRPLCATAVCLLALACTHELEPRQGATLGQVQPQSLPSQAGASADAGNDPPVQAAAQGDAAPVFIEVDLVETNVPAGRRIAVAGINQGVFQAARCTLLDQHGAVLSDCAIDSLFPNLTWVRPYDARAVDAARKARLEIKLVPVPVSPIAPATTARASIEVPFVDFSATATVAAGENEGVRVGARCQIVDLDGNVTCSCIVEQVYPRMSRLRRFAPGCLTRPRMNVRIEP